MNIQNRFIRLVFCACFLFVLSGCVQQADKIDASTSEGAVASETTNSQKPAANQGTNESSPQENHMRAVITINGTEYGMTITDTVVGRAFAQKLETEGEYKVIGLRAADDICCSESESLETDTSENMPWKCGGVAWFGGWFTIWVSAGSSGRDRPVVAQIDNEHLEELQALSGSVEIIVQLAERLECADTSFCEIQ